MATIQNVAKAKGTGLLLEQLFGVEPSYQSFPDYVRVYYQPDRLKRVQERVDAMSKTAPGGVRLDWFPVITPFAVKKAAPYIVGIFVAGYLLGKL